MNYAKEIPNCPFCNCKPVLYGYEESKEKYNIKNDRCTIHCPGCGMDMYENRMDTELEDETGGRLIDKWSTRNETLGVNISDLISNVKVLSVNITNLVAKQNETIAYLASYSDPIIQTNDIGVKHQRIIKGIKDLKSKVNSYKTRNNFLIAIIFILLFTIWMFKGYMIR